MLEILCFLIISTTRIALPQARPPQSRTRAGVDFAVEHCFPSLPMFLSISHHHRMLNAAGAAAAVH